MSFTDEEIQAAVEAISGPAAFDEAQALVMRTAPQLQRVLAAALESGGWFGPPQQQAIEEALGAGDPEEALRAVRTIMAEEARLGMFVGVAVGLALAKQLGLPANGDQLPPDPRN